MQDVLAGRFEPAKLKMLLYIWFARHTTLCDQEWAFYIHETNEPDLVGAS